MVYGVGVSKLHTMASHEGSPLTKPIVTGFSSGNRAWALPFDVLARGPEETGVCGYAGCSRLGAGVEDCEKSYMDSKNGDSTVVSLCLDKEIYVEITGLVWHISGVGERCSQCPIALEKLFSTAGQGPLLPLPQS